MRIYLQHVVEDVPSDCFTTAWVDFDLSRFSREKTIWDYQQDALQNALKALWKYCEDFGNYQSIKRRSRSTASASGASGSGIRRMDCLK